LIRPPDLVCSLPPEIVAPLSSTRAPLPTARRVPDPLPVTLPKIWTSAPLPSASIVLALVTTPPTTAVAKEFALMIPALLVTAPGLSVTSAATPPAETSIWPPLPIVAPLVVPPDEIVSVAPLLTVVLTARPNGPTSSWPKGLSIVPLVLPAE